MEDTVVLVCVIFSFLVCTWLALSVHLRCSHRLALTTNRNIRQARTHREVPAWLVCFQDPGCCGWEWYFLCVCLLVCLSIKPPVRLVGASGVCNRKGHTAYVFIYLWMYVCLMTAIAFICMYTSVDCLVVWFLWGIENIVTVYDFLSASACLSCLLNSPIS